MPTHYGGSMLASGRLSQVPDGKHLFKMHLFCERLVRFDMAKAFGTSLLSDKEIAKVLGKSVRSIESYRRTVPYLKKRMELTSGVGLDAADDVEKISALHRQQLKLMLPVALRTIYDAVQRPTNPNTTLAELKFKVDVAKDILDREGTLPKITRTDNHLRVDHNFSDMDGVSQELLDSVDVVQEDDARKSPIILDKIAVNDAFGNTETLSVKDMEASLASLEAMKITTEIQ
jgi:hypothetical protein